MSGKSKKGPDRIIVQRSANGWEARRPGASRSSTSGATQKQVVSRSREIMKNSGGGELTIRNSNGQFQKSDTIAPGNDPFPPRDAR